MAEDKKNPLGPTGDQVRSNVERLRESRGLTKKDLADRVAALGRPIPPLGISRIEAGTRRVDADDLAALAIALRVSPMTLLAPWTERQDTPVEVTGVGTVTALAAWQWADGRRPLSPSKDDPWGDVLRYRLDSRPAWARDPAAERFDEVLTDAAVRRAKFEGKGRVEVLDDGTIVAYDTEGRVLRREDPADAGQVDA